ncbi:hypothetical protein Plec18170_003755 [Paecilomyces lecythidis]
MSASSEPSAMQGKKVIVTGGSRGIGAAITRGLILAGASVIFLDLNEDLAKLILEELTPLVTLPQILHFKFADVSNRKEIFKAIEGAVSILGGLDGLVNAAGVERRCAAETISEEELDLVLGVNLKGSIFASQAAFPYLKNNKMASIINFGSGAGVNPHPGGGSYSASKGAIHAITRTFAAEWGSYGIRVNSLLPAVRTELVDEYRSRCTTEELQILDAQLARQIFLGGKMGDPARDLVPVVLFMLSDASRFVTAQIIPVDGGIVQTR